MTNDSLPDLSLPRRPAWKWWVCGLLLLATMLNYMDRLTLNLMSYRIMTYFRLSPRDYAMLESAFAFAFALGAIIFGWLADRWPVRWLYPAAVIGWSLAGFATGLAGTFVQLLLCRAVLGLFEAGNWPCALRTTQHILPPSQRTLGNSLLQSGAALGAIFTPIIIFFLGSGLGHGPEVATSSVGLLAAPAGEGPLTAAAALFPGRTETGDWRVPFLAIGVLGITWALLWLPVVRSRDLQIRHGPAGASLMNVLGWLVFLLAVDTAVRLGAVPDAPEWLPLATKVTVTGLGIAGVFLWLRRATADDDVLPRRIFFRRFWVLVTVVVAINTTWHYFRAWLPLFLQTQHGYTQEQTSVFMIAYYASTDVGSLGSGFVVLLLIRAGLAVHVSRVAVFLVCAVLTLLGVVVAFLPTGPLLLGVLLVIGFASLALFPVYYALSQELTVRHQGKVTGALGCINWLAMSLLHEMVGASIKRTEKYSEGLALAGLAPLVGLIVLVFLWGRAPGRTVGPALPEKGGTPDERIRV